MQSHSTTMLEALAALTVTQLQRSPGATPADCFRDAYRSLTGLREASRLTRDAVLASIKCEIHPA